MNCKNCQTPQRTDFKFCPNCGARVVQNRLTFKQLSYDITERYFNVDNRFIKTVVGLCIHPEEVIGSYINGVRRRYLNPISHLGIALTLSGLLIFIMQKVFSSNVFAAVGDMGQQINEEASAKLSEALFDYSSLMFVLYIPVFAIAGYLTFNRKNYLFSEYVILFMYVMAQWSVVIFPISLAVLLIVPSFYFTMSMPLLFVMVVYCVFVMQRIHRYPTGAMILRSFVYFILSLIGYFGIVIVFYIIMFLTGTIELSDFASPPK